MNVTELAKEIYGQNKERGWWDDEERCLTTLCMLIVSELAEAMEGHRKNLMDDHLPHRKMVEVELADAAIRLMDLAGKHGWDLDVYQPFKMYKQANLPSMLLRLVEEVCDFQRGMGSTRASLLLSAIVEAGRLYQLDIMEALHEKLAYNKTRADHSRAARQAEGGKRY